MCQSVWINLIRTAISRVGLSHPIPMRETHPSFHFRVSTTGLLVGLFVISHAMGCVGDDDWAQAGVGAIEGKTRRELGKQMLPVGL